MWYLLYDNDSNGFEMFHEQPTKSITYKWFTPSSFHKMFTNAIDDKKSVQEWITEEFYDTTIILHTFQNKPTEDEVMAIINSHPELLI